MGNTTQCDPVLGWDDCEEGFQGLGGGANMVLLMRDEDSFYHFQLLHPLNGLIRQDRQAPNWHSPRASALVVPTDVTFPFGGNIETRENSLTQNKRRPPPQSAPCLWKFVATVSI